MSGDIIDFESLARLKKFNFRSNSRVRGPRSGIHKSYYKGISPDFLEHKEYHRGDEIKQVDWRLFGRHDRLYVKRFEDEVNLMWCVLLDTSASMGYGEGGLNKLAFSKKLAATLSYLLLAQGDIVGLTACSEERTDVLPPRSGATFIGRILDSLNGLEPSGRSSITAPLLQAMELYKSDASFVIISDLFLEEGALQETLRLLRAAKKETTVFHVLHPDELGFDFEGQIEFQDMETAERVIVDADGARAFYLERMQEFSERLRNICNEYETTYVNSPTSASVEETLIEIAAK